MEGQKLREMISQDHWDYTDEVLARHGVPRDGEDRGPAPGPPGNAMTDGVLGWTEATGGIGSGRQMAAAMALGADGVWTGSIWLTVAESNTGPAVMEKLLDNVSFDAPDLSGSQHVIDEAFVRGRLEGLIADEDLSRFIL